MYLIVPFMRIFSIAKKINKKITISKQENNDNSQSNDQGFLTESYSFDLPFFWKVTYIPRYVKYFNSFECESKPLVKSTKYEYKDASTLYKETKFPVWVKNSLYNKLVSIDLKIRSNRKMYKVSDIQMYQAFKKSFYGVPVLRL